ncbi:MAG: phosphoadenosine phosphosulfate reductase [Helicobacteraceae bacterium CG2_30_36_10]|nr:MAG: phosphoadenosine phosphosulfate reductase [Helicobacteraceae bacterium CG2_30_36_10]
MKNKIEEFKKQLEGKETKDVLDFFLNELDINIALASSLGAEDQVLTDLMYEISSDANIFTLDTGRLPKQTYDLIERTNEKYKKNIKVFFPQTDKVENLVNEKGMFSFYYSIDERKECCYIRKIEPLKRALSSLDVWITGLRREQSVTRGEMQLIEWDAGNNLLKLNPLIEWSEEEVWNYIKNNNVPYNKLHDNGYPSIGCEPCSRAVEEGADIRSGRWWWEDPEHKECGLHIKEKK